MSSSHQGIDHAAVMQSHNGTVQLHGLQHIQSIMDTHQVPEYPDFTISKALTTLK